MMPLWNVFWLRPNQLLSDQQTACFRPEAAELMTQYVISSHFCSPHHAMLLSHEQQSDSVEITTWLLQQRRAPAQVPLRGHRQETREGWVSAGTEPTSTHTHEHAHPWGALSSASMVGRAVSAASISPQWQGGGRLLSGCFCHLQERQWEQTEKPGCLTH